MQKSQALVVLLFCTIALTSHVFGQSMCDIKTFQLANLKGQVVSDGPKGKEPIEKAKVELRKLNKNQSLVLTVLTDKDGYFEITKAKKGKYVVSISKREWKFFDFTFGFDKIRDEKTDADTIVVIQLGVSPIEPCGGGLIKLENQ